MKEVLIAPSLLAVDPAAIGHWAEISQESGADWHHIDVMDGHFVPNLTFGLPLVESLKKRTTIPLDVHIMISNPDKVGLDYVKAGADVLSFHIEASDHPHRLASAIKELGAKSCVAINPGTPVEQVFPFLDACDGVMFMSVNPGFGGQKYIPYTEVKIQKLVAELHTRELEDQIFIEIDGGIGPSTIKNARTAGANVFVAGSAVFKRDDIKSAIEELRSQAKLN